MKKVRRVVILKTIFIFKKNVRLPFSHLSVLLLEIPIKITVKELQNQCESTGTKATEEHMELGSSWEEPKRSQRRAVLKGSSLGQKHSPCQNVF